MIQTVLSPVLKSPYGYHIFLVGRKKPEKQKTFAKVQKQIIKILKTREVKEQFQIWLKQELANTSRIYKSTSFKHHSYPI